VRSTSWFCIFVSLPPKGVSFAVLIAKLASNESRDHQKPVTIGPIMIQRGSNMEKGTPGRAVNQDACWDIIEYDGNDSSRNPPT
jgi:hypothetical protein